MRVSAPLGAVLRAGDSDFCKFHTGNCGQGADAANGQLSSLTPLSSL